MAGTRKSKRQRTIQKLYENNPEYREKVKQRALARYYRIKEQKSLGDIPVS